MQPTGVCRVDGTPKFSTCSSALHAIPVRTPEGFERRVMRSLHPQEPYQDLKAPPPPIFLISKNAPLILELGTDGWL